MEKASVGDRLSADCSNRAFNELIGRGRGKRSPDTRELRRHIVRTQRLHDDALICVLDVERLREKVHVGFGRRVDGQHGRGYATRARAVVDDDALFLAHHARQTQRRHFRTRHDVAVDHFRNVRIRLSKLVKILRISLSFSELC